MVLVSPSFQCIPMRQHIEPPLWYGIEAISRACNLSGNCPNGVSIMPKVNGFDQRIFKTLCSANSPHRSL